MIKDIIEKIDENKDGEIQFNEFFNMMHSHKKE